MNLEREILKEHSKRQATKIGNWIGSDPKRFAALMELFLHGEYRVCQRAAWIVSCCSLRHPQLAAPWLGPMIRRMQEPGVHIAVKRNVLRIFEEIEIPRALLGRVVSICFDELASPASPIAVRAYSMTILANAAEREPGIARELRAIIEQLDPASGPGLCARTRHILRRLDALRALR